MIQSKPYYKLIQYLAVSVIVVCTIAFISAVSNYEGFLSLSISMEGISLTVDGR
jgi:hypothetical protein